MWLLLVRTSQVLPAVMPPPTLPLSPRNTFPFCDNANTCSPCLPPCNAWFLPEDPFYSFSAVSRGHFYLWENKLAGPPPTGPLHYNFCLGHRLLSVSLQDLSQHQANIKQRCQVLSLGYLVWKEGRRTSLLYSGEYPLRGDVLMHAFLTLEDHRWAPDMWHTEHVLFMQYPQFWAVFFIVKMTVRSDMEGLAFSDIGMLRAIHSAFQ